MTRVETDFVKFFSCHLTWHCILQTIQCVLVSCMKQQTAAVLIAIDQFQSAPALTSTNIVFVQGFQCSNIFVLNKAHQHQFVITQLAGETIAFNTDIKCFFGISSHSCFKLCFRCCCKQYGFGFRMCFCQ